MISYQILAHEHIFRPGVFFAQCHASTLELLPDGSIAAAWFAGTHEKNPDVAIWFAYRRNGIWSAPVKVADKDGVACWNPVLFWSGKSLLLFYKIGAEIPNWQTMVIESRDSGFTWSEPRELVNGDCGGRGPVKNKCIRLKNGAILAPASIETGTAWDCFTDYSEDNGATWERSPLVPIDHKSLKGLGIIQPSLWQDGNGVVHMVMRSTEGCLYESHSYNSGRSWSEAVPTNIPNNNSGIDLKMLQDGRLVLVYNPISGNWVERTPISFSISEDNGKNWSKPVTLEHDPFDILPKGSEFSYPAVISIQNQVLITYTWKRRSIAFFRIEF